MEYDSEVCRLSPCFYADYPVSLYPEILRKASRPYICLLIDVHADYLICLPFRTNMRHSNGFSFRGSRRSLEFRSGIDYSKLMLVTDFCYIDSEPVLIDDDEFKLSMAGMDKIVDGAVGYIDGYVDHVNGVRPLHPREYERRYQFSTLPYFHDILGLPM